MQSSASSVSPIIDVKEVLRCTGGCAFEAARACQLEVSRVLAGRNAEACRFSHELGVRARFFWEPPCAQGLLVSVDTANFSCLSDKVSAQPQVVKKGLLPDTMESPMAQTDAPVGGCAG